MSILVKCLIRKSLFFSAASALLLFSPGRWMQNPKNRLFDQPSNADKGKLMIKRKIKNIIKQLDEWIFLNPCKMKLTILKDKTHIIEEYSSGSPQDFSQITSLAVALWPGKFDFHRTFLANFSKAQTKTNTVDVPRFIFWQQYQCSPSPNLLPTQKHSFKKSGERCLLIFISPSQPKTHPKALKVKTSSLSVFFQISVKVKRYLFIVLTSITYVSWH